MKTLILLSLLFLFSGFCFSQTTDSDLKTQKEILALSEDYIRRPFGDTIPRLHPLSPKAFSQFITNYYNFALLGSNAPSTGIKVQTDKPSISLKGNILFKNAKGLIGSVELTSSVDNSVMQIFSGDKLNTLFKATIGLSLLMDNNWANYNRQSPTTSYQRYNRAVDKYNSLKEYADTARVLSVLFGAEILEANPKEAYSKLAELLTPIDAKNRLLELDKSFQEEDSLCQVTQKQIVAISAKLAAGVISEKKKKVLMRELEEEKEDFLESDLKKRSIQNMKSVLNSQEKNDWLIVDRIFSDLNLKKKRDENLADFIVLLTNYDRQPENFGSWIKKSSKYADLSVSIKDSIHAFEIKDVEAIWTSRSIKWFNLSPYVSNANFMYYDSVPNTLTENKSFLYGLKGSYNFLRKWKQPHRFLYLSVTLGLQKVNSFNDMDSYSYKKTSTIKIPDPTVSTDQETISDEESGTAYKGTYATGFGLDIPAELYLVPWKNGFAPGLYAKAQYSYSYAWINANKLAVSLGLIWNVTNSDKDAKNLLSIVPYASFSNINQEYKDVAHTIKRPMHELFRAGVMVGVPINIGK